MENPPWMENPSLDGNPPRMENPSPRWRTPPPWMENPLLGWRTPPDGDPPGWRTPPPPGQCAGGTHPTGMHSCSFYFDSCLMLNLSAYQHLRHVYVLPSLLAMSEKTWIIGDSVVYKLSKCVGLFATYIRHFHKHTKLDLKMLVKVGS